MKGPIQFQNQAAYEIQEGESRLILSPGHGARILTWQQQGREVIHWPATADWQNILKVRGGNPILFPFAARHFVDGKKDLWRDAQGVVRPMPQHGFARDAKFAVVEEEGPAVRLRLTDSEATRNDYPFAFQFDVVMTLLAPAQLEIRFETTNRATAPLPYYAGHHFYLAIPHAERGGWTLDLPCEAWGRQKPNGAIAHETPNAEMLRLDDPAIIDRFQIKPRAERITLAHGESGRSLVFDLGAPGSVPWYAVTTWTEAPDSDFFCVEPWLGLPNAIHHGEGLRWIDPGAMETATCVLDASRW
jgi:galactose mutarotase-like enzyme